MTPPPSDDPDEPSRICFFDFYFDPPYSERIAVFDCADVGNGRSSHGLHHFQVRAESIGALLELYRRLKASGHLPIEASNHGPGTSFLLPGPGRQQDRTVLIELLLARRGTEVHGNRGLQE